MTKKNFNAHFISLEHRCFEIKQTLMFSRLIMVFLLNFKTNYILFGYMRKIVKNVMFLI